MRIITTLILISCFGWLALWTVETFGMFSTVPIFKQWIFAAGLVVTAITAVVVLATFILKTVLTDVLQFSPSGLVRAIVYSGLTFSASLLLLSQFGIDVGAILTTSAILGAVVGLAMQSTLGSIISGMAMSAEPLLKIGSAIRFEDKTVYIEQKTWRHVVGRRLDNIRVIIPNSMLAGMAVLVLPEDGPTRFDVNIHLPPDVPPHRVTDLLAQAFSDMEHLDSTRAVMVSPIETLPEADSILYRIRLWARTYSQVTILQGEVPRRAWYVLNRAGIHQPRNILFDSPPPAQWSNDDLGDLIAKAIPTETRAIVRSDIRQYQFGLSELLQFPAHETGRQMMIVEGETTISADIYLNPLEHGRSARPHLPAMGVQKLSTIATFRKIADRLAKDVGPVAEILVRDLIKTSKDQKDLVQKLALHIEGDEQRASFISAVKGLVNTKDRRGPGTIASLSKDAAGRLMANPELRALTGMLVVTFSTEES
jgi:small-conductance mechanosensitive channel